jgi:hypothetical protein
MRARLGTAEYVSEVVVLKLENTLTINRLSPHRALRICILKGSRKWRFLRSEVPLYCPRVAWREEREDSKSEGRRQRAFAVTVVLFSTSRFGVFLSRFVSPSSKRCDS